MSVDLMRKGITGCLTCAGKPIDVARPSDRFRHCRRQGHNDSLKRSKLADLHVLGLIYWDPALREFKWQVEYRKDYSSSTEAADADHKPPAKRMKQPSNVSATTAAPSMPHVSSACDWEAFARGAAAGAAKEAAAAALDGFERGLARRS